MIKVGNTAITDFAVVGEGRTDDLAVKTDTRRKRLPKDRSKLVLFDGKCGELDGVCHDGQEVTIEGVGPEPDAKSLEGKGFGV